MVWYRRIHRWLGIAALLFLLLLAVTGIALNHVNEWRLDKRHVDWPWLLDAYGIEAPQPSASFADGDHRATVLGNRLYLDGQELARDIGMLAGLVTTDDFIVVATVDDLFILTASRELVERRALEPPPEAVGVYGERVIVRSNDGALLGFDAQLIEPERWEGGSEGIHWSQVSPIPPDDLRLLESAYRGRGITIERLLADLHSGRIFTRAGPLLMDAVGILLVILSFTGLLMWLPRSGNGPRGNRRPR